ncbi:hypothetical protein RHECNPAF_2330072 [Rhizobium etli CNPAF512]|nr:hypothetical protein RHECNPAF_2330072 [Rhizobium etli CNPAF512]
MGKQRCPLGPGLSTALRRSHASEDHVHQHPGAAYRIVQGKPAFGPAIAQPVGQLLSAGKHAFPLQDIDELRKLCCFTKDELQETSAVRISVLVHVEHEDPFKAFGDRTIFGGPRQIKHQAPMRSDDGGEQLFFAFKQTVERLFGNARFGGDDRGRASGISVFHKNPAGDFDDLHALVFVGGDFRPASSAWLVRGSINSFHDRLTRPAEAHADDLRKRTTISEG